MCGIIGQINLKNQKATQLSLKPIHHRGPDGEGTWTNELGNVFFGHTRLAIIEPTEAGYQPMVGASKRYVITFNGEIYNHMYLRNDLPGIEWRGNSDTETLLELLSLKGIQALNLVKGMFAFALYDINEKSVLLVRDRFGIKPLYLRRKNNRVSFSSEVRALFKKTEKIIFKKTAISQYLAFGHLPDNEEICQNVFSLPPGSWYKIFEDGTIKKGFWWPNQDFLKNQKAINISYPSRVKTLVTKAIEEHLISDVGIGSFLSGGIDSSIISIVAGKALGKNLQTFTLGFSQLGYDESKIAKKVAIQIGSDHTELRISEEDCLSWIQDAVLSMDVPSIDAINTFIIAKAVRETGLKVALSGLGGDELFGGYPSFSKVSLLTSHFNFHPFIQKSIISFLPEKYKSKLQGIPEFSATEITLAIRRFTAVNTLTEMGFGKGNPLLINVPECLDTMGRVSWAELFGYTIPMLLKDSDQMSMAVGLEVRVPFMDHHLIEEVLKMPEVAKKGSGTKPLLVEAFKDELPRDVYNRSKQGFVLPMQEWIKGPLNQFTKDGICAASKYFDLPQPQIQMDRFFKGKIHWTRVWHWSVLGHYILKQEKRDLSIKGRICTGKEITI